MPCARLESVEHLGSQEAEVSGRKSGGAQPSWSEGLLSASGRDGQGSADEWVPQMARMPVPDSARAEMELADRPSGMLEFLSQVGAHWWLLYNDIVQEDCLSEDGMSS